MVDSQGDLSLFSNSGPTAGLLDLGRPFILESSADLCLFFFPLSRHLLCVFTWDRCQKCLSPLELYQKEQMFLERHLGWCVLGTLQGCKYSRGGLFLGLSFLSHLWILMGWITAKSTKPVTFPSNAFTDLNFPPFWQVRLAAFWHCPQKSLVGLCLFYMKALFSTSSGLLLRESCFETSWRELMCLEVVYPVNWHHRVGIFLQMKDFSRSFLGDPP